MRDALILAGLLACLATPIAAQDAAAPGGPPNSMPDAPAVDKKHGLAAKLSGLVAFVNAACPDLKGDPAVLNAAVERLGIDPKALEQGDLSAIARSYLETYRKDVPENCRRAIETFGPSSRIVPNLVVRR